MAGHRADSTGQMLQRLIEGLCKTPSSQSTDDFFNIFIPKPELEERGFQWLLWEGRVF